MTKTGLSLGPVLFNWSADRLRDFYARIADEADVDRVHLGEVVCGKRQPFTDRLWPELIDRLTAAGKEVVLSTLALPYNPRERASVRDFCEVGLVAEINDLTALPAVAGKPFLVGPFVNVYNEGAARFLAGRGATGICLPVELPAASVTVIAAALPEVEFEQFAFGRLPLALSGRCYHARLAGLHKDGCQFVCDKDPDGLAVDTLDGQRFLAINGIQTLSHGFEAFCPAPDELARLGVRRLRLSPHTCDMVAVSRLYRALLDGKADRAETLAGLRALNLPGELVDGFSRGEPGSARVEMA
ncbi:ubiquinone anaerobic biosynthesis protein UbiV [Pleomorphomonas koreensis]|uniref:ubiquinone anaerobic biosynthesis protein UbiV n=1 Tax=Pleomorphomonas koreensis TaxID=257440 RepID=UPI0003FADCBD|nr:U32 family peptidase [Pleomorphomonas koreensis]